MKALAIGLTFLPLEALPLLIALAGLSMILGLRRLAGGIGALVLVIALTPALDPIIDATLAELPAWVSWALLAGAVVAVFSALGLGRFMGTVLAHTCGILLADAIRFFFLLPFRGIGFLFRLLTRRQ